MTYWVNQVESKEIYEMFYMQGVARECLPLDFPGDRVSGDIDDPRVKPRP